MKVFSSIKKMISIESPKKKAGRISICILITALIFIAFPAWSADYYIAQSAAGSMNGSSCANAKAISYLTGSWSGKVSAGDTAHLCGTLTSALTIGASGTSGNVITIKFEDNAKFSKAAWTSYIIYGASKSYLVIDGGTNGTIECTDNGDLLGNQALYPTGVKLEDGHDVEIKNLIIQNLYIKKFMSANIATGAGIFISNGSNYFIHHNTINNTVTGVQYQHSTAITYTNNNIYNNTITHCNWGIGVPLGNGVTTIAENLSIYNNEIAIGPEWTEPSGAIYHHNGIFIYSVGGDRGYLTNLHIYNNYIHGPATLPDGWQSSDTLGTGFIFIQGPWATGTKIYNNVLAGEHGNINNGAINLEYLSDPAPMIYNNTMIATGSQSMASCIAFINNVINSTPTIKNNICYGGYTGLLIQPYTGYTTTLVADDNLYYGNYRVGNIQPGGWGTYTLADWQTKLGGCPGAGRECSSVSVPQDLNANYTPKITSPVVGKGVNLTSLGITALNSDKNGVARPSSGVWDMGAYAYGYNKPKPPLNLRIN